MKRNKIVESLMKEGFSEKTLVKFTDKQLMDLNERIFTEQPTKKGSVIMSKTASNPVDVKRMTDQGVNVELREKKPSAGLSKEKKSEIVKSAKRGEDIGKKGKGFKEIEKKAKKSGAKNPKAVAAAAMWKGVQRENIEIKDWVENLAVENFHSFTSKNEIMELIQVKLNENNPAPSKPKPDAPVREKPTTKPGKPKRENPFEPKHTPKPKALKEKKEGNVPEFMSFKKLGIKFKDSN